MRIEKVGWKEDLKYWDLEFCQEKKVSAGWKVLREKWCLGRMPGESRILGGGGG